jgi:hypothetical protein
MIIAVRDSRLGLSPEVASRITYTTYEEAPGIEGAPPYRWRHRGGNRHGRNAWHGRERPA